MKVLELIEKLSELNQHAEVIVTMPAGDEYTKDFSIVCNPWEWLGSYVRIQVGDTGQAATK